LTSSSPTIEPAYVVDTHALVWYLTNRAKLSRRALAIFQAAERGETMLIISAIALAELYFLHVKHRLFPDFAQVYARLAQEPYIRLVAFAPEDVLDFAADAAIPEMHDRIIVGLARRLGRPLMTKDASIVASGLVPVAW
jgi:PIN domain nuclease of toxin-antitoxin system